MDTAIVVALIGSLTSIALALIEQFKGKKLRTSNAGAPPPAQATAPSPRSRFFLILVLGFSITANAVLFTILNPLSKPTILSNPEAVPALGSTKPTVTHSGDTVAITCPPGTYMSGISFSIQKGGDHGQVYNVAPIYQPFPSSGR